MMQISYSIPDDERPEPSLAAVHERLLDWFAAQGRDLPWRHTRDPYAVLVAEMMLQQTGVDRVIPKYHEWLARFPTLHSLAAAPRAEVIRLWSGLGYNSRAIRLQEIARQAVEKYGGKLPSRVEDLLMLKGIGRYTAGAVACFAFEQDVAFVDTNIRRVLSRVFLGAEAYSTATAERAMYALAARVVPVGRAWAWYQAVMDLGATICTDAKPACLICPLQSECRAAFRAGRLARENSPEYRPRRKEGPWHGSSRYYRGRIVAVLRDLSHGEWLTLPALASCIVPDEDQAGDAVARLRPFVERLAADGLIAMQDHDGVITVALPD